MNRSQTIRIIVLLGLLGSAECNPSASASCRAGCSDDETNCYLALGLYSKTPGGQNADSLALGYLSCRSAFYVCTDTCDQATTRL
ncbi:MAG: hypothetical protein K1X75_10095 [Leptospirales bacterium]|nr:hypothetical protein [Leptospirales bacterium]